MADFEIAVKQTLVHEGGFVDNPNDPGGATKYGITQKDMPNVNIADITEDQATAYYSENYWKPLYSQIENQAVASKIFDMGVLFGVGTAVKEIQRTLSPHFPIGVDGNFGPETLNAINQSDSDSLLSAYKAVLVAMAFGIAQAKPQTREFLAGWGRRINS
jgi:lysozyme family protein